MLLIVPGGVLGCVVPGGSFYWAVFPVGVIGLSVVNKDKVPGMLLLEAIRVSIPGGQGVLLV